VHSLGYLSLSRTGNASDRRFGFIHSDDEEPAGTLERYGAKNYYCMISILNTDIF